MGTSRSLPHTNDDRRHGRDCAGDERIGFHSMEVWGGATFDVATRFLNEDPWERPKI